METLDLAEEGYLHREKLNRKKISLINLISFFIGFSQAFFIYILSNYLKLSFGRENVGIFYLIAYLITLILLLNLYKFVKKFGKSDIFHFSLLYKIIITAFLLVVSPGPFAIVLVVLYIIFGSLEMVSLDMILESHSNDKMSGRIRGKFLTILNAGFLIGPFLSTWILGKYDYNGVFLFLLIFNLFISGLAVWGIKKTDHQFDVDLKVRDIIKKIKIRKNVGRIFYVSFILEFFYAMMIIHTPLYLINIGLSWGDIGIIFTVMLIPFVILQYPLGVLADKKTGEKEFIIFAVILMGLSTGVIYFIGGKSILVWSMILFFTRIGAAIIEILRDSYFYKKIDGYDVDLIGIFRTAMPLGYIAASGISIILLLIFPLKFIFFLVGLIVFSALWPAIKLADSECE
jgi:MFS family permease